MNEEQMKKILRPTLALAGSFYGIFIVCGILLSLLFWIPPVNHALYWVTDGSRLMLKVITVGILAAASETAIFKMSSRIISEYAQRFAPLKMANLIIIAISVLSFVLGFIFKDANLLLSVIIIFPATWALISISWH